MAAYSAGLDDMKRELLRDQVQQRVTQRSSIHDLLERVLDPVGLDLDVEDQLISSSASLLAVEAFLFCCSGPGLTS